MMPELPRGSYYTLLSSYLDGKISTWASVQMLKIKPEHCPYCGSKIITYKEDGDFKFNKITSKCDECGFSESQSIMLKTKMELKERGVVKAGDTVKANGTTIGVTREVNSKDSYVSLDLISNTKGTT